MRFSSLAMVGSTHFRCSDGIIAALLAHPNYKSNKVLACMRGIGFLESRVFMYKISKRTKKIASIK